jgi:hypothetical protein
MHSHTLFYCYFSIVSGRAASKSGPSDQDVSRKWSASRVRLNSREFLSVSFYWILWVLVQLQVGV